MTPRETQPRSKQRRDRMTTVYDFSAKRLNGDDVLQALYDKHQGKLEILGFPCNQFGKQEPGGESEISEFCELNYGVSFPMFGKIDVNGDDAHPLYKHLKQEAPGILGSKSIKWNFT